MFIQPVQSQQNYNPSFCAKLDFIGRENLLPKGAIKKLQDKARSFGTDNDKIYVKVGPDIERAVEDVVNFFGITEKVAYNKGFRTSIQMSHVCPSIDSVELTKLEYIQGKSRWFGIRSTADKEAAYQRISQYIDKVKAKFAPKEQ